MEEKKRIRGFEKISSYRAKRLPMPHRGSAHSAGYDICSTETVTLKPCEKHIFKTGLKAYMQHNEYLSIHIRSSLAFKKGLQIINVVGIIDSDYYDNPDNEGHILIGIRNMGEDAVTIKKGDKIAQGIFMEYLTSDTGNNIKERRGGVGSTGK